LDVISIEKMKLNFPFDPACKAFDYDRWLPTGSGGGSSRTPCIHGFQGHRYQVQRENTRSGSLKKANRQRTKLHAELYCRHYAAMKVLGSSCDDCYDWESLYHDLKPLKTGWMDRTIRNEMETRKKIGQRQRVPANDCSSSSESEDEVPTRFQGCRTIRQCDIG